MIKLGDQVELIGVDTLGHWVGVCVKRKRRVAAIIWQPLDGSPPFKDADYIEYEKLRRICCTFGGWRWYDGT